MNAKERKKLSRKRLKRKKQMKLAQKRGREKIKQNSSLLELKRNRKTNYIRKYRKGNNNQARVKITTHDDFFNNSFITILENQAKGTETTLPKRKY